MNGNPEVELHHVSDRRDIACFHPRLPANLDAGVRHPVVWAVSQSRLSNYMLPRDCPRVCMRTGPSTTDRDRRRFFGGSAAPAIIAIEPEWAHRADASRLWVYRLPPETFECVDADAGYHVSARRVAPLSVTQVDSPLRALRAMGVEVRLVDDLRALAQDVARSSLVFSVIRLRHARALPVP